MYTPITASNVIATIANKRVPLLRNDGCSSAYPYFRIWSLSFCACANTQKLFVQTQYRGWLSDSEFKISRMRTLTGLRTSHVAANSKCTTLFWCTLSVHLTETLSNMNVVRRGSFVGQSVCACVINEVGIGQPPTCNIKRACEQTAHAQLITCNGKYTP